MGRVFFGRSPGGRPVAVKFIRSEYAHRRRFRARFAREVEAARRIGGFHTALVIDADPDADPPWMVTAYIPGPSLQRAVDEHGPLDLQAVRTLGAGLAEGLLAIHACGLVHRDLKPGNVILAADGPRIIDLGVVGTQDADRMTATGAVLGTYAYMSPEQVNGDPAGPASDVFALGSVLGFAAGGRSPFGAETVAATLHRITGGPPDLGDIPVENGYRDLIAGCLAKDPAARPELPDILARLAGSWPDGNWLPAAVMNMIHSTESESIGALKSGTGETDPRMHHQSTLDPGRGRRLRPRAVLVAGAAVAVLSAGAVVLVLTLSGSAERPPATRRFVLDDGRAFGPGGWSQFTVRVDPANTGVRLTRRLDSSVSGQSAVISVNGRRAGLWVGLDGSLVTWKDQTVEFPAPLTADRKALVIRNTFASSTKDFNEFTYYVDQRIGGRWARADVVDIGPGHPEDERAHRYRVTAPTWAGTRNFSYSDT
nr:hypothetical protein GCM10010200_046090 [Actinomadura rugatobispora]